MMRVALGVGFRAGVTAAQLDAAIRAALARYPAAEPALVATLADKACARALRTLCARRGWPLVAFEAAQLASRPELAASGRPTPRWPASASRAWPSRARNSPRRMAGCSAPNPSWAA